MALTTVDRHSAEVGKAAARLLIQRIEGRDNQLQHILLPPSLDIRSSSSPVSQLMGHSNIGMTARYAHLAPETQRAVAMELEGILDNA